MKYSFKAINDVKRIPLAGKLINIVDISPEYSKDSTEVYGRLLAAFGQPAYTTMDLEDAYCYVITATDASGNEHVLNVYDGPSGPAIGGEYSALDAAEQLRQYISTFAPADYEYEGYYFDGPTKVRRGIANGEVFYSEVEISDEEYGQAYKLVYPNA